jgi:DNA-binding transcriptional MerR regulator
MSDVSESSMGIAELAERAGVTPRTVRYYVAEGLLPPPGGRGQRRAYGQEHLRRLATIRQLKAAYLPLHEIRRRLDDPISSPLPRTGEGSGEGATPLEARAPGPTPAAMRTQTGRAAGPSVAVASAASSTDSRPPIGFGGTSGIGRIEIYDPPETVWRRHVLAPGVELHYRESDDPRLTEAIQRLIREAATILDASEPESGVSRAGGGDQKRKP